MQSVDELIKNARAAQRAVRNYTQEQIDEDAANRARSEALAALSALAPAG